MEFLQNSNKRRLSDDVPFVHLGQARQRVLAAVAGYGSPLFDLAETVAGYREALARCGVPDDVLARAGSGQVAELRAERDALRAVTEQQAGLIAAYQAALGGRGTQPDELRRVERDLDLAGGECNRLDAELAELQHSHRALLDQHHELQADHDLLLTQLATTPAVTVPSDRDSHYEAELRRCWLVIAWLRKAIGPREAMRLLDCAYLGKLEQVADQLAEVGRLTAEGRAVAP
ncbi:MAG: hypothetical protein VW405_11090 [Rhodospirillaceae bacterium]